MTLRELGQSIVDFWNGYIDQITTEMIFDWDIGNIFLTLVLGFVFVVVAGTVLGVGGAIVAFYCEKLYKRLGVMMDSFDKRYGVVNTGWLMVVGTVSFFAVFFALIKLYEIATR